MVAAAPGHRDPQAVSEPRAGPDARGYFAADANQTGRRALKLYPRTLGRPELMFQPIMIRRDSFIKPLMIQRNLLFKVRPFRRRRSLALLHRLAAKVFDLAVDAAQLGLRPGFQVGPERGIDAQQKWFAFRHFSTP